MSIDRVPPKVAIRPVAVGITDAARMAHCSRQTIYRMIEDGTLTVSRIGKKSPRILIADIERILGVPTNGEAS